MSFSANLCGLNDGHFLATDREYLMLHPPVPARVPAHRYDHAVRRYGVVLIVARDCSRVFVGGGQWGFDGAAREADAVEIEALAERFGLPELRRAAALRGGADR